MVTGSIPGEVIDFFSIYFIFILPAALYPSS
jgi:hypothetical protein